MNSARTAAVGSRAAEHDLGGGLVLRTVRDERDVERYAGFHREVVSEIESAAAEHLLRYHPGMSHGDFFLVEDTAADRIVSTTCLVPWRCEIEDVAFGAAMLEMVATHPDYRHRGLVRAQIEHFHRVIEERGFDFAIIQGIPFYYRQYGYAYACDHYPRDVIDAKGIARGLGEETGPYALHLASSGDIAILAGFYDRAMGRADVRTVRPPEYWHFLIDAQHYRFMLLRRRPDGRALGYALVHPGGAESAAYVAESWAADDESAQALLMLAADGTCAGLEIAWPEAGRLVQVARGLGSRPKRPGQWLVRLPNVAAFLERLGPVLERRLSLSAAPGLSTDLCINLYRRAYVLRFVEGSLLGVDDAGFVDASMGAKGGDLNIPPDAFARLVLGYRDLDALWDAWPDTYATPSSRPLVETLFPTLSSYYCMPYHVFR